MKWKIAAVVLVTSVLSASVALAVSSRTVVTGSKVDQYKVVRGDSATMRYYPNGSGFPTWQNMPDMVGAVNVPAGTTRLLVLHLHTEDVPHGSSGSFTVFYRLVVDGQPTRTDSFPTDRPVLGSFDAVGPLTAGNHSFQVQVSVPDFICTTPDSCSTDPFPIGPAPYNVSFDKPWQIGVERIAIP